MFKAQYFYKDKWLDLWPGNVVIMGTKEYCEGTLKDTGLASSIGLNGQPIQIRLTEVPQETSSSRN